MTREAGWQVFNFTFEATDNIEMAVGIEMFAIMFKCENQWNNLVTPAEAGGGDEYVLIGILS